jgi:hypothetical protein
MAGIFLSLWACPSVFQLPWRGDFAVLPYRHQAFKMQAKLSDTLGLRLVFLLGSSVICCRVCPAAAQVTNVLEHLPLPF